MLLSLILTTIGCRTRTISYKGITYREQVPIGAKVVVKRVYIVISETNAVVELEGYGSDQAEFMGVIAEGLAKGAMKGVMPKP